MIRLYATTAIIGLIITASDGPLFPWLNLFGLTVFALSLHLSDCHERRTKRVQFV